MYNSLSYFKMFHCEEYLTKQEATKKKLHFENVSEIMWSVRNIAAIICSNPSISIHYLRAFAYEKRLVISSYPSVPSHVPQSLPSYGLFVKFHIWDFNPLNPELNPICYLLALLGGHHFIHVSRIRVKLLTFRRLMSHIYMEHPFLMFLDHTQRRSTVGRTPLDE